MSFSSDLSKPITKLACLKRLRPHPLSFFFRSLMRHLMGPFDQADDKSLDKVLDDSNNESFGQADDEALDEGFNNDFDEAINETFDKALNEAL